MCFQAQNASGRVSGPHGSGEGTGSCHIDSKSRPLSTAFKILSTATLDKNHRIYIYIYILKSHLLQEKLLVHSLLRQKCTKHYFFSSDHKIDTDLQISKTLHNTFSSLSRHLSVTNIRASIILFSWKIHF